MIGYCLQCGRNNEMHGEKYLVAGKKPCWRGRCDVCGKFAYKLVHLDDEKTQLFRRSMNDDKRIKSKNRAREDKRKLRLKIKHNKRSKVNNGTV